jgi:hypothetical protein
MAAPLKLSFTILYEEVEDGWIMARVAEMPGAISQGRTRAEARENVRDALRELRLHQQGSATGEGPADGMEPLELTIAP